MLSVTPSRYQVYALYNVIFGRLALHSSAPWDVVTGVGLGERDLKYLGSHSYVPGAPVDDPVWSKDFLRRTSFGKLIGFYLRNPDVALSEMNRDLTHAAPVFGPKTWPITARRTAFLPAPWLLVSACGATCAASR